MKYILINYNFDPSWVKSFTDDYLVYDRSDQIPYSFIDWDENLEHTVVTRNIGNADYDRLTYLIDNYEKLPEVFLLAKSNLFKFITKEEFEKVKDNQVFTPLLTQNHKTYSDDKGIVCYYKDNMYFERNDSWFLNSVPAKYIKNWKEWADIFDLPNPNYIPFFPGGNCILTPDRVYRYTKEYYIKMREMLKWSVLPGEAHLVERSLFLLWS